MISMKMADEYDIDVSWRHAHPLHGAQHGWSRFHQDLAAVSLNKVAGLEASMAGKGVARTKTSKMNPS